MSGREYDWWPYVMSMVRRYPELKARQRDLARTSVTTNWGGVRTSGGKNCRSVEDAAARELKGTAGREFRALHRAVSLTELLPGGRDRLRLISLLLWEGKKSLAEAVSEIPCSPANAEKWQDDFLTLVAEFYGLLDEG